MKGLIRRILREQTSMETLGAKLTPKPTGISASATELANLAKESEIFYLPSDKKWEYTLIDDIWHTRKIESESEWISLGGEKFKDTVRKLDKILLDKGDWKPTISKKKDKKDTCTFIIPVAWPTYEPKLEKGAGNFEVWGARVYAAIMANDFTSKEGTYGKLGHGGVATVEQDGRVRFFEFGRYAGSEQGMGITLKYDLGKIAKFTKSGNRCRIDNIKEVANAIKANSYGEGKSLEMEGHLVPIPNVEKAIEWANNKTQRKYKAIDLEIGDDEFNCGTFVYDVAEKGGLDMGNYCFPDPESMVDSFQNISLQKIRA